MLHLVLRSFSDLSVRSLYSYSSCRFFEVKGPVYDDSDLCYWAYWRVCLPVYFTSFEPSEGSFDYSHPFKLICPDGSSFDSYEDVCIWSLVGTFSLYDSIGSDDLDND